ncbi:MAG: M15 family metallopeptidase [Muribaculaceae bacterium]|nr:M15 family metallopeptidase [Muribaculaceae bacterium]
MKNTNLVVLTCAAVIGLASCTGNTATTSSVKDSEATTTGTQTDNTQATPPADDGTPKNAQVLINAYPECIKGYEDGYIVMKDGSKLLWDDGKKKDFVTLLDNSDVEDMFAFHYDRKAAPAAKEYDAGRSRCDELFKKMYGNTKEQVAQNLVPVKWFDTKVRFTSINGAAKHLEAVAADLEKLVAQKPELKEYLKSSGTFNWRPVRGAKRMSAHSYGIAFDIGVAQSDYWRHAAKDELAQITYKNRMPMEIVEVFEKHGFAWGGRWYHYDTMHFEYRPEILAGCQ